MGLVLSSHISKLGGRKRQKQRGKAATSCLSDRFTKFHRRTRDIVSIDDRRTDPYETRIGRITFAIRELRQNRITIVCIELMGQWERLNRIQSIRMIIRILIGGGLRTRGPRGHKIPIPYHLE